MKPPNRLKQWLFSPLWLLAGVLVFIVACGGAAATPEAAAPAATTAPAATAAPGAPAPTAAPGAPAPTAAPAATAAPGAPAPTAAPAATAAPTTAPVAGAMFKTDIVRFALPTPDVESNRTWAGTWLYIVQHDVFAETLLRVDENTSEVGPLLAESWEWSEDFRTWSFKLREGIPWHFGWGDFSSADVLHSFDLVNQEESLVILKEPAWDQATPEVVDDFNIKFHFENPYLSGNRLFSRWAGDLILVSKAQWDAEGLDAFDQIQTAGTGPYQLTDRKLGESLSYERVPEGHWAYSVDFEEFQFVWAPESLTRMAMLLAAEVHLSQIERTLQPDAEARGMRVINSTNEAAQTYTMFGGLYRENTPEWPDHYTPGLPLQNMNIRKALNKALDREAINTEIYLGRATTNYNHAFHPNNEGWNPEWVERWDEMYGYDRDEAIALLAAEGYGPDNHLKLKFISTTIPGSPELHDVIEATQIMYADINVDLEIEKLDFGTWLQRGRDHELQNTLRASRNLPIRSTQEGIRVFFTNHYASWYLNEPFVNDTYLCLERSADLGERDKCARDIGNYLYDNYIAAPMFHLYADVTVNPEFIESYVWPGLTSAGVSHFHNIKGVAQ